MEYQAKKFKELQRQQRKSNSDLTSAPLLNRQPSIA